jgi:uncharacterized protein YukE
MSRITDVMNPAGLDSDPPGRQESKILALTNPPPLGPAPKPPALHGPFPSVSVDPAVLRAAAQPAHETAAELRRTVTDLSGRSRTAAARALPGFRSAEAVAALAQGWEARLCAVASGIDRTGADLTNTAQNYQAADDRAASRW